MDYSEFRELQHHGLICPRKFHVGLYLLDILVAIINVRSSIDCALICIKHTTCSSANFIFNKSEKCGICTLSATVTRKRHQVLVSSWMSSIYITTDCIHSEYNMRYRLFIKLFSLNLILYKFNQ